MTIRFLFTPLGKKMLKRKLKKFWKEWGITWEQFEIFLGACFIIVIPILLEIILSILVK